MEASDHNNPMFLDFKEQTIREAAHSGPSTLPIKDRKMKRIFCHCVDRHFHCARKSLAQFRADVVIHPSASLKSASASGSQTTGRITIS